MDLEVRINAFEMLDYRFKCAIFADQFSKIAFALKLSSSLNKRAHILEEIPFILLGQLLKFVLKLDPEDNKFDILFICPLVMNFKLWHLGA